MKIAERHLPLWRRAAIIAFVVPTLVLLVFLWAKTGGGIPFVTGRGYKIVAMVPADAQNPSGVQNLVIGSNVRVAGVPVGAVTALDIKGTQVAVHLNFTAYGPLHRGVRLLVRPASLLNATYIQVIDGKGPPLRSGTVLPAKTVQDTTTLQNVLDTLQPSTRKEVGSLVSELNSATAGSGGNLSAILSGLGQVGRQGSNTLDVLAAQSQDLQDIVRRTTQLLDVLDTGNGQIANLATAAEAVTKTTAAMSAPLGQAVTDLPNLIDQLHRASPSITQLVDALTPLAQPLRAAAPNLDESLVTLPSLTRSLEADLPQLNTDLGLAPTTLQAVPGTAADLNELIAPAQMALENVDPMLAYLRPYGPDVASFFTNFGQALAGHDANGNYLRAFVILNADSLKAYPVPTDSGVLHHLLGSAVPQRNPYPSPSEPAHPTGFTGSYPRIQKEG